MVYYDPFDPQFLGDPYPVFKQLRDEAPVYQVPERGYWVLSRYGDVHRGFRDFETLSSAKGVGPEPIWAPALITADPPDHTRLRRLVTKPFRPSQIDRDWTFFVRELAEDIVGSLVGAGTVDLVRELTWPLPVQVIAEMLGIPREDMEDFKRWSDGLAEGIGGHLDPEVMDRTAKAYMAVYGYFAPLIEERRRNPRNDLISALCSEDVDDPLDDQEINHFAILLLLAGNETTTNLLGQTFMFMARHRDEFQRLRDDPGMMAAAVEECVRFASPTQALFRQTAKPLEVHGVTIPEGERVMLLIAAANRDEREFEDPEALRLDRDPNFHLGFGSGIHLCIGAPLARLETRVVLEVLLERTSGLVLDGEPEMSKNFMLRGPSRLPATLVPA